MPILGAYPVIDNPTPSPSIYKETRTLRFRSLAGATILPSTGWEFVARQGVDGLDIPQREVIREPIPGMDGTRLIEIRTGEREVFVPLFLAAKSGHLAYLDKRDELAALFNYRDVDYVAEDGTFDLVADSARGERTLRCLYLDGMKGTRTADVSGSFWESIGLNLLAVQPYWYGEEWTTPTIVQPEPVAWFGRFPGRLSATLALGQDMPVTVGGQVGSWVTVEVTGPATSLQITAPGLSVSIPAGLASGETATIITDPRKRAALFNGTSDWSRIAPSDRYTPLKPGIQKISAMIAGATSTTSARVFGPSLYERPW